MDYYEDNKETNLRLFKLKFAYIFNDVDDNLFKEIFGHTSVKLADKLINTQAKKKIRYLLMISKKTKITFSNKKNIVNL